MKELGFRELEYLAWDYVARKYQELEFEARFYENSQLYWPCMSLKLPRVP